MAKGPAVVLIARHGARLDAADKTWHLTSPTPYDPPLTYGGWQQARALGLRIAAHLHQRATEQADAARNGPDADVEYVNFGSLDDFKTDKAQGNGRRPAKKRKVVIHTSPFLRCVQTSTAVAAGIAQYQAPQTPYLKAPAPPRARNGQAREPPLSTSPHSKPLSLHHTVSESAAAPTPDVFPKPPAGPDKILLRIDAFLGEWLSPDYYEDITPPPNSTMMVAGAKADLLRRGDYIQEQPNANSSKGHFPGGWMSKDAAPASSQKPQNGSFPSMGSLAQVSPFRERSSSHGSALTLQKTRSREHIVPPPTQTPTPSRTYEPPVPSYSVSPADPIPRGYVTHARDACIQVDFQWDSMRAPQGWGDGGEYGDEWSTMHKRFRKGLGGMMQWYRKYGSMPPKDHFAGFTFQAHSKKTPPTMPHSTSDPFPNFDKDTDIEDDEELVLVLVTHGAGCNALLGAISNQPVLIDVGLAALSMAVRRDEPRKPSAPNIHERRGSVVDPGMSDTYEMKLLASLDHLRPGVDPSKLSSAQSQNQSPAVLPSPSLEYRRRFTGGSSSTNSPIDLPFALGDPFRSWNSSLGSIRRTTSSGSNSRYLPGAINTSGGASPSTGLWSGSRTPIADNASDGRSSPGADMVLAFSNQLPKPKTSLITTTVPDSDHLPEPRNGLTKTKSREEREGGDQFTPLVGAHGRKKSTASPGLWGAKPQPKNGNGLWGPPKLDDVYEHGRGPKRRWTVTEREESL